MKKGHYLFPHCGALNKFLTISCIVSFLASVSFIIRWSIIHNLGLRWWHHMFALNTFFFFERAWTLFFFILFVIFAIAKVCLHKVCEDVSRLIKEIDDKVYALSKDEK